MSQYTTLVGAEDVSRTAWSMRGSAETVSSAASQIHHALETHQRFLEDWLVRFESVMNSRDGKKSL